MTNYFPHNYNSRNDRKLMALQQGLGLQGLGAYWCIIEMLYEENGSMPMDCERIAYALRTENKLIQSVIEDYGLFDLHDGILLSHGVIARLQKIKEKSVKAQESAEARWKKGHANALRTQSERNAIKVKESKRKEIPIEFEKFWELYPKKKSKQAALLAFRRLSLKDSAAAFFALPQHIELDDWKKDGGRFIPHAATWLNGRRFEDVLEIKISPEKSEFQKRFDEVVLLNQTPQ
jgi:hypothetical protein